METQVRRRKASPGGDSNLQASQDANGGGGRSSQIDSAFTYLVVLVLVVIFSCLAVAKLIPDHPVSQGLDFILNAIGLCPAVYAVVIDAGSTGSRVLAFTFHQNPVTGNLVLDDELWQEVKPGLSSFASSPEAGADTITTLLSLAQGRIPADRWSTAPVTLKGKVSSKLKLYTKLNYTKDNRNANITIVRNISRIFREWISSQISEEFCSPTKPNLWLENVLILVTLWLLGVIYINTGKCFGWITL